MLLARILYVRKYRAEYAIYQWNSRQCKNDYELDLSDMGLTYIPLYDIVKECKYLNIRKNKLTSLPDLPNVLVLDCSYNKLITLPSLPLCETLDCSYNKLKTLPSLPLCEMLDCHHNLLTSLPDLSRCLYLYCSHNPIISLPNMPNGYELKCCHTKISYLPDLSNYRFIDCNKTNLLIFPRINKHRLSQVRINNEMIGVYDKESYEFNTNCVGRIIDYIFFDNDYMYISELQAKLHHLKPTRNYYRFGKIILKAWNKYKRRK